MSNSVGGTPIVLVHGILGFGQLRILGMTVAEYFRGIRTALLGVGHAVPEPPSLNPAGSIAERAADLKHYLGAQEHLAGRQVHLSTAWEDWILGSGSRSWVWQTEFSR